MTTWKIGSIQTNGVSISNLNPQEEAAVRRYDSNKDGILTFDEALRFYASKTNGKRPESMSDVLKLIGGRQHTISSYAYPGGSFHYATPNWKGDFHIDGIGFGNVRTGRTNYSYTYDPSMPRNDLTLVLVDCDGFNKGFIERDVVEATLVVGLKGFKATDSESAEVIRVPLEIETVDGYPAYSRGGGSSWVPERKAMFVAIETADLNRFANGQELNFYVEFKTADNKRHYINRDGVPGTNFVVPEQEFAPQDA